MILPPDLKRPAIVVGLLYFCRREGRSPRDFGAFQGKTLPIPLQTSDLGAFLAETLPNRRAQGLCARTFARKRARMRGRWAGTSALLPETRADEGSRSPDARTSDHNARGVRAAGQSPDSQPGSGDGQQRQAEAGQQRLQGESQRQQDGACETVFTTRKKLSRKFFIFVELTPYL